MENLASLDYTKHIKSNRWPQKTWKQGPLETKIRPRKFGEDAKNSVKHAPYTEASPKLIRSRPLFYRITSATNFRLNAIERKK